MPLTDIYETEETSPARLCGSPMEVSPVSNIINDLCRSSLDSGGTRRRCFQLSRDALNAYRRVNSHRTEGIIPNQIKETHNDEIKHKLPRLCSKWLSTFREVPMVDTSHDKENDGATCWRNSSPQKITRKTRLPFEDFDPNSQDSGYGASDNKEEKQQHDGFQFAEPSGVAPRRMSVDSRSPVQSPMRSSPLSSKTHFSRSSLAHLSSGYESMVDDGFTDLLDIETLDDMTQLPSGISTLLSGDLVTSGTSSVECDVSTTPEFSRTASGSLRRTLSLGKQNVILSRSLSKVRTCLFRSPGASSSTMTLLGGYRNTRRSFYSDLESPQSSRSYKRPPDDTLIEDSPRLMMKRSRVSRSFSLNISEMTPTSKSVLFGRSLSEDETNIKLAIHRSVTDSDLTGDFSKPCVLPLESGGHEDLKSIKSDTLAALIRGEFVDRINSYKIVDCRYPYEYDGGHIEGAINLYNRDLIEQILLDPLTPAPKIQPDTNKRDILVFHCEFSYERGPNLSRFLRSLDRERNKEHYPALHYPEIYLLHGGYRQFYREQKEFCLPQGYRPMRHPDHEEDLKQFRIKSKSWQGDKSRVNNQTVRTNLKRLGL